MFSAACSGKSAISSSKGDRFRAGLREVLTGVSSTPSWPPVCEVGVGEEVPFVSFIEEGDPPAVLDSMLQFPWSPVVVAPPGEVVAMGISVGEEEGPGV